ncbi:hypothetical protein HK096_003234, partial [Nowakowskiella sp. JEL0078]
MSPRKSPKNKKRYFWMDSDEENEDDSKVASRLYVKEKPASAPAKIPIEKNSTSSSWLKPKPATAPVSNALSNSLTTPLTVDVAKINSSSQHPPKKSLLGTVVNPRLDAIFKMASDQVARSSNSPDRLQSKIFKSDEDLTTEDITSSNSEENYFRKTSGLEETLASNQTNNEIASSPISDHQDKVDFKKSSIEIENFSLDENTEDNKQRFFDNLKKAGISGADIIELNQTGGVVDVSTIKSPKYSNFSFEKIDEQDIDFRGFTFNDNSIKLEDGSDNYSEEFDELSGDSSGPDDIFDENSQTPTKESVKATQLLNSLQIIPISPTSPNTRFSNLQSNPTLPIFSNSEKDIGSEKNDYNETKSSKSNIITPDILSEIVTNLELIVTGNLNTEKTRDSKEEKEKISKNDNVTQNTTEILNSSYLLQNEKKHNIFQCDVITQSTQPINLEIQINEINSKSDIENEKVTLEKSAESEIIQEKDIKLHSDIAIKSTDQQEIFKTNNATEYVINSQQIDDFDKKKPTQAFISNETISGDHQTKSSSIPILKLPTKSKLPHPSPALFKNDMSLSIAQSLQRQAVLRRANQRFATELTASIPPWTSTVSFNNLSTQKISYDNDNNKGNAATQSVYMNQENTPTDAVLEQEIQDKDAKIAELMQELQEKTVIVASLKEDLALIEKFHESEELARKNRLAALSDGDIIRVEKEISEQETLIHGYQIENEKLVRQIKETKNEIKEVEKRSFLKFEHMQRENSMLRAQITQMEFRRDQGGLSSAKTQLKVEEMQIEIDRIAKDRHESEELLKREVQMLKSQLSSTTQELQKLKREDLQKLTEELTTVKRYNTDLEDSFRKLQKKSMEAPGNLVSEDHEKTFIELQSTIERLEKLAEEKLTEETNFSKSRSKQTDIKKIKELEKEVSDLRAALKQRNPGPDISEVIRTLKAAPDETVVKNLNKKIKYLQLENEVIANDTDRRIKQLADEGNQLRYEYE